MKSIRSRLIFWISVLFIFIGALIYFPLSCILPKKITSQILKRDVEIAKYLSNETKDALLFNDRIALSLLLRDNLDNLEDAHYLFVESADGSIISHTFTAGFPKGLLSFGLDMQGPYKIKEFLNRGIRIYDIAVPILKGELGALHLGVSLQSGKKDIQDFAKINYYVAGVILAGLGIGISIFLAIGFLFSNQIIKLKNFATKVGKGDLQVGIDIKSKDEIGALASAFNEMTQNLKEKIQEIKRLNTIEERNRISLELHDGCAQDFANIIKRLELCEKLFKIDPVRAFEELDALRENTKEVLGRTREVIFDLKSPQDLDFNLLDNLNNYIMKFKKQNDIDVKLNISGSINEIPSDKAKSIFCIIAEALTNTGKHAQAKNVELSLESNNADGLIVNIKDDGKGFDIESAKSNASNFGRWGLINMRQRVSSLGGAFSIESKPNLGSKISINIPLGERENKCQIL